MKADYLKFPFIVDQAREENNRYGWCLLRKRGGVHNLYVMLNYIKNKKLDEDIAGEGNILVFWVKMFGKYYKAFLLRFRDTFLFFTDK